MNNAIYRIAKDKDNLKIDSIECEGLTWTHYTIDKAYSKNLNINKNAVIVKITNK